MSDAAESDKARLYIVPTPIGNLEDITLRALRILKEVDFVACEDTRHSGQLLKHFEISKPLVSFHSYSSDASVDRIIERLIKGERAALISDAGTPGISDPGFVLIQRALAAQIPFTVLPGASAAITGLVASGMSTHRFLYLGFLPLKKGRQTLLKEISSLPYTIVLYEAPHRLVRTLRDLATFLGEDRPAAVGRELTKLFEETVRGSLTECIAHFEKTKPRGECTITIGGYEGKKIRAFEEE